VIQPTAAVRTMPMTMPSNVESELMGVSLA
jgi:hypothetical protein